MMKTIFKHHFVHERRCWRCKWRQSQQRARIPPACEGAPRWQRQQRRRNPAAAEPLQLSWRVLGVEEAEIKASVATLMFPPMERRSTRLQRPGKALCLRRSGGSHRLVRQIQETPFSVSEGMLADFQSLPVRAGPVGSYQVKSQTVSTAPNQTKALRF